MDCEPDASNMWSEMREFYKQMTLRLREKQIENEENHFFYSLVIIHDIHLTRYHLFNRRMLSCEIQCQAFRRWVIQKCHINIWHI